MKLSFLHPDRLPTCLKQLSCALQHKATEKSRVEQQVICAGQNGSLLRIYNNQHIEWSSRNLVGLNEEVRLDPTDRIMIQPLKNLSQDWSHITTDFLAATLRGNVCLARAWHPNQCSGHPSQYFTLVMLSWGCISHNRKGTSHSCMIGRSGGEGV